MGRSVCRFGDHNNGDAMNQTMQLCPAGNLGPGIHSGVPMTGYLSDPCPFPSLSASCALTIDTASPAHAAANHPRLGGAPAEYSKKADVGTAAHDVLFGGEGCVVFVEAEDWRTKFAQQQRDDARAAGKVALLARQRGELEAMVSAARAFCADAGILHIIEAGVPEETVIWEERGEGVPVLDPEGNPRMVHPHFWFRARPDLMSYDAATNTTTMLHYKTTEASANPAKFIPGIMRSMGYAFTLRFYARGAAALARAGHPELANCQQLILVQEQFAPYACSRIALAPASIAIEDARVGRAVATWKKCLASGKWPAYTTAVHYAEPTAWELAAAEAANVEGGGE